MHIAILVTNTDDSAFAARHPRDGEKFRRLLSAVRPDWRLTVFDLPVGEMPEDPAAFDALVVGGSPASVHDDARWIAALMGVLRAAHAGGVPLVGACFGHQAIARALGGTVGRNPAGWVFGATETRFHDPAPWMDGAEVPITLAAAHNEQVTALPPGAVAMGSSAGCPLAAFRIGATVFTTQHHPEIDAAFLSGLVEEYAPKLPAEVASAAQASLALPLEGPRFGEWIARFVEQARQDRAESRSIAVT